MSSVRYEIDGPVAIVTIDRPAVRNAVDGPTAAALAEAFRRFDADDERAAAVLTGAGGTFCAGADLKGVADTPDNRVAESGVGRDNRVAESGVGRGNRVAGRTKEFLCAQSLGGLDDELQAAKREFTAAVATGDARRGLAAFRRKEPLTWDDDEKPGNL